MPRRRSQSEEMITPPELDPPAVESAEFPVVPVPEDIQPPEPATAPSEPRDANLLRLAYESLLAQVQKANRGSPEFNRLMQEKRQAFIEWNAVANP